MEKDMVVFNNYYEITLRNGVEKCKSKGKVIFQPYGNKHFRKIEDLLSLHESIKAYFVVGHFGESSTYEGTLTKLMYNDKLLLTELKKLLEFIPKSDHEIYALNIIEIINLTKINRIPLECFIKISNGQPLLKGQWPFSIVSLDLNKCKADND